MAVTPTGEQGKLIQLKRTSLAYNSQAVVNEQLNFGEPLYNDNDKTLLIGDSNDTSNDNLKVFKAVERKKADSQVYLANASDSTLDITSNVGNLYTETNTPVFVKEKDWGVYTLTPTDTTYNFSVDSDNVVIVGTEQSSSFESFPCLVKVPVEGMKDTYIPTVTLYLSRENSTSVSNIKSQNKAFSCIGRCESDTDYLYVIYYKQPQVPFNITLAGG